MLKREAITLATDLIAEHLDGMGWSFALDRAKRRAGCCKYRLRTITLSVHYVLSNGYDDIRDTILHEIAHAIVGPGKGHGREWKQACRRIGAKPVRCYDAQRIVMPKGRYVGVCPNCKTEFHRHRKPKRMYGWYCRKCGSDKGSFTYRLR